MATRKWITLQDFSSKYKVQFKTVEGWARKGVVPSKKVNNRILVPDMTVREMSFRRRCADPKCGRLFYTMQDRQIYHTRKCAGRHNARRWARKKARERREQEDDI